LSVDKNAVLSLLRGRFPDRSIRSVEPLGEGDHSAAYAANHDLVVRVAKHEDAARALAREACVMPRLRGLLSTAVPSPSHTPGDALGPAISVHERLQGVPLTPGLWRQFPGDAGMRVAAHLGGFLSELHSVDVTIAQSCGLDVIDHRAQVRALDERARAGLTEYLPRASLGALRAALERYLAGGAEWECLPALLHGDVSPEHVLVDAEAAKVSGVIDWGDVSIGDPARDFIYIYEDWGPKFLSCVLRGYERESSVRLRSRVHFHYLVSQLDWTLSVLEHGRDEDIRHGSTQ
jgi:aminoglycoside 2''-phosphotransferase